MRIPSLKSSVLAILAGMSGLAGTALSQVPAIPNGPWKDLFNGKDLAGWAHKGTPPWSVSNGILQAKAGGPKSYLIWKEPLKDIEFSVKYRLSSYNANSGVQFRSYCQDKSKSLPDCGGSHLVCGPQLDVAQPHSGKLFEECVGFLQSAGPGIDNCRRTIAVNQWMTEVARIDGPKVSVWLNGVHCLDFTLNNSDHLNGTIFAIQSHDPFDLIEWEHVRIRKLNVRGCTNKSAPNYNPEATLDDGSCIPPTAGAGASAARPDRRVEAARSRVDFSLPESGAFTARLLDVNGALAGRLEGTGPLSGSLPVPRPGLYFLELDAAGARSRHRIHNF